MANASIKYLLAIESAIAGGSISLFADGTEIDRLVGPTSISRAEDLLPNIELLLSKHGIEKQSLNKLVVSAGPGSFTGIKIGIATVLGLRAALGTRMRQFSMLEAIARSAQTEGKLVVALPVGRDTVCWQSFTRNGCQLTADGDPVASSIADLGEMIKNDKERPYFVDGSIFERINADSADRVNDVGQNLAIYLARAAIENDLSEVTKPLFVGKQR